MLAHYSAAVKNNLFKARHYWGEKKKETGGFTPHYESMVQ